MPVEAPTAEVLDLKRFLAAFAIAGLVGLGAPASAQTDEVMKDGQKAGEAAKAAGKDAGESGKAAGEAGKDAGKTVAATCKDGTTHSGTSRTKACSDHGGVAHWNKTH